MMAAIPFGVYGYIYATCPAEAVLASTQTYSLRRSPCRAGFFEERPARFLPDFQYYFSLHAFSGNRNCIMNKQASRIHFGDHESENDHGGARSFLVTGATGFIGQLLVRALIEDGRQVCILTRNPAAAARIFGQEVECIGNLHALGADRKIDVIINLAGARILGKRWNAARKATLRKSRIDLTLGLVGWIAGAIHKPALLLSASAIGYYGIQSPDDDTVLTETSPPQSIFMSLLCQEWEAAAQSAAKYGVQVACLRFGLVLGQQGALPMMLLPIKLGFGGPLGGGKQCLSWIHVHDLLRGMAYLCRHVKADGASSAAASPECKAYNFTAPEAVTQKQFSRIAAKVHHRPSLLPTPGFPMRILLGEQADLLLSGQRVAPAALQAQGFTFIYPTLQQALEDLR